MASEDRGSYQEWTVRPALAPYLACSWEARHAASGAPHVDRILPDGCMDLVWTGSRLLVAGPDSTSVIVTPRPGARFRGVRFRPAIAPLFLGVPASSLRDLRANLDDVLPRALRDRGQALGDALAERAGACEPIAMMEAALAAWAPRIAAREPFLERAVGLLRATPATRPVSALARDLGVSERPLHRSFVDRVGYGPKMFHRVVRLRRFLALAAREPGAPLAGLALAAGYADQAHLARDCGRLTGLAPSQLLRAPSRTLTVTT